MASADAIRSIETTLLKHFRHVLRERLADIRETRKLRSPVGDQRKHCAGTVSEAPISRHAGCKHCASLEVRCAILIIAELPGCSAIASRACQRRSGRPWLCAASAAGQKVHIQWTE